MERVLKAIYGQVRSGKDYRSYVDLKDFCREVMKTDIPLAIKYLSLLSDRIEQVIPTLPFEEIDHQKEQDQEIANMKTHFEQEIKELRDKHESDNSFIQEEQTLVIYGLLACLKGLKEQGCNGSVTEAIDKIEKHINQKAHHH